MSKASEWAGAFHAVERSRLEMDFGDDALAYVTEDGALGVAIGHNGCVVTSKVSNALALAHWIIDTFGEPEAKTNG